MKHLLLLALACTTVTAADAPAFTCKPVMISAGAELPASIGFSDRPMGHDLGCKIAYLVDGKDLIGFKLMSQGSSWSDTQRTWNFAKPAGPTATVEFIWWNTLSQVTVPIGKKQRLRVRAGERNPGIADNIAGWLLDHHPAAAGSSERPGVAVLSWKIRSDSLPSGGRPL